MYKKREHESKKHELPQMKNLQKKRVQVFMLGTHASVKYINIMTT